MESGPVATLLDKLLDPAVALAGHAELEEMRRWFTAGDYEGLAGRYAELYKVARLRNEDRLAVRLLLAERSAARRMGDLRREAETAYFLALEHRVAARFVPAELWARTLLRMPLTGVTVPFHARAWRELAALCEVSAEYDAGLTYSDHALEICDRYAEQPGMRDVHIHTLLQRSTLSRQRGSLREALALVHDARRMLGPGETDGFVAGTLALREGALELAVGRTDVGLRAYSRAETIFAGVSEKNAAIARLRQVMGLRTAGRPREAMELADRLSERYHAAGDDYRRGQVLLEQAEVAQELGDHDAVERILEQARPLYADATGVEALRWHRHMARRLIEAGDGSGAALHLSRVLETAASAARRDATRTTLALFDVLRLPPSARVAPVVTRVACGAALVAAHWQRTSLERPPIRWAMNAQREDLYAAALLLHTADGDAPAVATIAETGRADLLNHVLSTGEMAARLTDLPITDTPADPASMSRVFVVAEAVGVALRTGALPEGLPELPVPGELPTAAELAELGDVVVFTQLLRRPGASDWSCSCTVWTARTGWRTSVTDADPAVAGLLTALAEGGVLPERGVSTAVWERLGDLLLPADDIWAGTPERPRSVVICPDPRLWQLPLAAVRRQGIHLADVAELTLTPNLRTIGLLRRRNGGWSTDGPALSLLDPDLPEYHAERTALAAWPGGHRPLTDIESVGPGALLYLGGLGDRPGGMPAFGPGRVTLEELARLSLPVLVVLNGCWSGAAATRYGADPLSLAVGALLGGADTVIAGTGAIGAAASVLVCEVALALIGEGHPVRAALRRAQLTVRDAHPELGPYEWAGLCVVGIGAGPR
ncbi:CHAT domain-containing protein [Actinomadura scrupuli]|uniref:CHAT domain-containing protein n=1 Tax=Actinomadura scrupuli TaxID=559629 RepID=UPI003D983C0F